MKKDPAVLFYTSDFLAGTILMTDEEAGKYIRLLCYQHQNGVITPEAMQAMCKGNVTPMIASKFKTDAAGNYYNERMEEEASKRRRHSERQAENVRKRWSRAGEDDFSGTAPGNTMEVSAYDSGNTTEVPKQQNGNTTVIPRYYDGNTVEIPLGNGNGNRNGNGNEGVRGGVGEKEGKRKRENRSPEVEEVVGELNALAGRAFDPTSALTVKLVTARLAEHPMEDLIDVVRLKVRQWKADPKMSQYLQPATLFASANCAKYVEEMRQYRDHGVKLRVNGKRDPREQAREVMSDFVNGTYQSIYK